MMPFLDRFAWLALLISSAAGAAEVEGRLDWAQRVEMGTLVSGVVAEVPAVPGERVRRGQPLLRLEQSALKAAVGQAHADEVYLKKERDEARRELTRSRELYDRTLLSDHDLELAKIAASRAEARYQEARARLATSELELEHSAIAAPFDARVLAINAVPGQTVITRLQSMPLITLVAAGRMVVRLSLDEAKLEQLKEGAPVLVRVSGRSYHGRIESIGLEPLGGEPLRYPVRVGFKIEPKELLRAGGKAVVELP